MRRAHRGRGPERIQAKWVPAGKQRILTFLGLMLAMSACAPPGPIARPELQADAVLSEARPLATFVDATALGLDPAGRLFITEAGRDRVRVVDTAGVALGTYGGPGSSLGAFDGPRDIAPTNGLTIFVADAGNGRVQRFSRAFQPVESIPVGLSTSALQPQSGSGVGRAGGQEAASSAGHPIAVAYSPLGELFVIDSQRGEVLKWDRERRLERRFGGAEEAGTGRLIEPVALACDADQLYVADRGAAAVVVFDRFGTYIRHLAEGVATSVQAVTRDRSGLWIVRPNQLLLYDNTGRLQTVLDVQLGEALVDAQPAGPVIYLLTASRLYVAQRPQRDR